LAIHGVLPDAIRRATVLRRRAGRQFGEWNIEIGCSDTVADGLRLFKHWLVILRIGAVDRVLALSWIIRLAALVNEKLGEIPVATVGGLPKHRQDTHGDSFVLR